MESCLKRHALRVRNRRANGKVWMLSDALREEEDRLKGCTGMALCGLAIAYSFAGMYGLEKEVPALVPSEPKVRLLVWTWKWWEPRPSTCISRSSTTRFLAWSAGLSPTSLARVQRHGRARSPADNASITTQ